METPKPKNPTHINTRPWYWRAWSRPIQCMIGCLKRSDGDDTTTFLKGLMDLQVVCLELKKDAALFRMLMMAHRLSAHWAQWGEKKTGSQKKNSAWLQAFNDLGDVSFNGIMRLPLGVCGTVVRQQPS